MGPEWVGRGAEIVDDFVQMADSVKVTTFGEKWEIGYLQ